MRHKVIAYASLAAYVVLLAWAFVRGSRPTEREVQEAEEIMAARLLALRRLAYDQRQ
jgi:hypothetical protein